MATPPSIAKEPAPRTAAALVARGAVVWAVVGSSAVVLVWRVVDGAVTPVLVAVELPCVAEDEVTVGSALVALPELVPVLVGLALLLVSVSVLVSVADPVAEEEPPEPFWPVMWKGKPYWKVLALDSRVIMMP